jgi:hypothetical protein
VDGASPGIPNGNVPFDSVGITSKPFDRDRITTERCDEPAGRFGALSLKGKGRKRADNEDDIEQ